MPLSIASSAFEDHGELPSTFTCEGKNVSPPPTWTDQPAGTKSLVLIVEDPDGNPVSLSSPVDPARRSPPPEL